MGLWMQMPQHARRMLFDSDGSMTDVSRLSVDMAVLETPDRVVDAETFLIPIDDAREARCWTTGTHRAAYYDLSLMEALDVFEEAVIPTVGDVPDHVAVFDPETFGATLRHLFTASHIDTPERTEQADLIVVAVSDELQRAVVMALYSL